MSAYDPKRAFEPLGNCSTVTFKVKRVASIAMKYQMRLPFARVVK